MQCCAYTYKNELMALEPLRFGIYSNEGIKLLKVPARKRVWPTRLDTPHCYNATRKPPHTTKTAVSNGGCYQSNFECINFFLSRILNNNYTKSGCLFSTPAATHLTCTLHRTQTIIQKVRKHTQFFYYTHFFSQNSCYLL